MAELEEVKGSYVNWGHTGDMRLLGCCPLNMAEVTGGDQDSFIFN